MQPTPSSVPQRRLARQARQKFVEGLCSGLPELGKTVQEFLATLMAQTGTAREMQSRRDAWMQYQQLHTAWTQRTAKAWQDALAPHAISARGPLAGGVVGNQFELLSDDVVENKILASRMALTITEQVGPQFDTLRQRTQSLEGQELDSNDILRPDAVCLLLVEQWVESGLSRTDLQTVVDPLQRDLANLLQKHYQAVNVFYVEQGITPQTDLKSRVRRTSGGAATGGSGAQPLSSALVRLDNAGNYPSRLAFLPAGTYTVAFTCQAALDDPASNDDVSFTRRTATVAVDRTVTVNF